MFHVEHALFGGDAAGGGETGEFTVGAYDAVAGDEHGPRVGTEGGPDGAAGGGFAEAFGNLAIGHALAAGDVGAMFEDVALKWGDLGPIQPGLPVGPVVDEFGMGPIAEGGGVIALEIAAEFSEPFGDDFGMEIAPAVADDFAAVGMALENRIAQF